MMPLFTSISMMLLFIILMPLSSAACTDMKDCFSKVRPGRLPGHVIKRLYNTGYRICYNECSQHADKCRSFNYDKFFGLCELNSKVASSTELNDESSFVNSLISSPKLTDPCSLSPCSTSQMCIVLKSGGTTCVDECVLDWPVYDKTVIEDNAELYYKAGENFPYNCSADYMNNNNQICLASGLWRQTRPLCAVNCSFEIPCPVFEHTSVRQFTRRNGSTPSVETGCSEDHTTGTDGYYYYLEASGIPIGYQFTMTTASPFPTGHPICIHLWYHMNGRNMGSLHIVLQNQYGAMSNITIAEGSQGDTWKQWSATLEAQASQVWLSIVGVCGNNFRSDICLDDIEMYIC